MVQFALAAGAVAYCLSAGTMAALEAPVAVLPQLVKAAPAVERQKAKGQVHPARAALKPAKKVKKARRPSEVGLASWYGGKFHGRLTASGSTYNMNEFTAAHRTLRLGTWVKVTNLRNGRWVLVQVNDRGPFVDNRILDLSYAAGRQLRMTDRGLAKVRIEVIQAPVPRTAVAANRLPGTATSESSD